MSSVIGTGDKKVVAARKHSSTPFRRLWRADRRPQSAASLRLRLPAQPLEVRGVEAAPLDERAYAHGRERHLQPRPDEAGGGQAEEHEHRRTQEISLRRLP